jgi:hypothetical protein
LLLLRLMRRENTFLFRGSDMSAVLDAQRKHLREKIENLEPQYVCTVNEEELVDALADEHRIHVPLLDLNNRTIEPHEERRRERGDFDFFEYTVNIYTVRIPFDGEAVVFDFRPNHIDLNPPRATVHGQEVIIVVEQRRPDPTALRNEIEITTRKIKQHLTWLREMVDPLNAQLLDVAREAVKRRKDKVARDTDVLAAVGIPLHRRDILPSTVSVPIRRIPIVLPKPPSHLPAQSAEPALTEGTYQKIIKTMADMALVIERNPSAFEHLNEEQIRFHFLVPLNALYEGNATAETFSYEGKTDIQIRHQGRPIFTAECKFWAGPKGLRGTIDQLLSYVTWRDSKTAVLLFNRQKEFSKVLAQIEPTLRKHPNFCQFESVTNETQFRFILSHPNDKTRQIMVTILAFDIP